MLVNLFLSPVYLNFAGMNFQWRYGVLGSGGKPFSPVRILLMRNTRPVRGVSLLRVSCRRIPGGTLLTGAASSSMKRLACA